MRVRKEVARILMPKRLPRNATVTQEALLTLSRDARDNTRLITTNFDRLFEKVIAAKRLKVPTFCAPLLPIPKASKWNGLVYLHGLLPQTIANGEIELNRLIMTSGDFGLAYLTERWAARFASELFRNFVVCFVGYSLGDPVLRYMMDALAADRSVGEGTPEAYAFGAFKTGTKDDAHRSWVAKGVIPILYEVPKATNSHAALHGTLAAWAETYRDGVVGKEQLIARYAVNPPGGSTQDDNFAGRILWAVSHASGLPAKLFAELDPVPPLSWLQVFESNEFKHDDLPAFMVSPDADRDEKLRYSLLQRPTRYKLAEHMSLVHYPGWSQWDSVMEALARWLTRHMDDRDVILLVAKSGGRIHPNWARVIERHLAIIDDLRANNAGPELERLASNAPRCIPRPFMRSLWRAALAGRLHTYKDRFDPSSWLREAKGGLTATLRIQLREMLSPRLDLNKPFAWKEDLLGGDGGDGDAPAARNSDVEWEIVLALAHPWDLLVERLQRSDPWRSYLPLLLQDFAMLLREALDLMQELGGVVDQLDDGHIAQSSIGEHPQNRRNSDWTALLELTRDAWLAMLASDAGAANALAVSWWHIPYATFKRLALFAATKSSDTVLSEKSIEWLLSDGARWLWEDDLRYEVIRILVDVAPRTSQPLSSRLQTILLQGPPPEKYRPDIEPDRLRRLIDHAIWLRLSKMTSVAQFVLPAVAVFLASMRERYPDTWWSNDDRDEFSFWLGTGNVDDDDDGHLYGETHEPLLVGRQDVVAWLKRYPSSPRFKSDDWRKRCSEDFAGTSGALSDLALGGTWLRDRWQEALQAWAEDGQATRSWEEMAPLVLSADDAFLKNLSRPLARWLQKIAADDLTRRDLFESLASRLIELTDSEELSTSDSVGVALNHPIGQVTDAYFRWWYATGLRDGQSLASPFRERFTQIANTDYAKLRHGRVFLAKNAIALYRVDREWAQKHLFCLFDWAVEAEALSAWKGFLWTPQLHWPFITAIKPAFLQAAGRYKELGDHGRQYADLLTFAALDGFQFVPACDLAAATRALPSEGLGHAAHTVARALAGAGEKVGLYWRDRIVPYMNQIWPTELARRSPQIADAMARLTVAAGEAFPEALELVRSWLMPLESADYPVHLLMKSGLTTAFPDEALALLGAIINVDEFWAPSELRECLTSIAGATPALKSTAAFRRLDEFARRHNK